MSSVEEAEAWTFVKSKRNRQSGKRLPIPGAAASTPATSHQAPKRTTTSLSVAEILSDHKKFAQQWTDSDSCSKLRNLIKSRPCHPFPTKAICLGLGSFDPEDGSWQIRRRSHIQLAAFMTIVDSFADLSKHKINCFFQEPCFTAGDKSFLKSIGYEVVDSPRGFEEVSEDTVLYGVHLYRDIYSSAIEKAIPAMFIGTGYDVWERYDWEWLLVRPCFVQRLVTDLHSYADADAPEWAKMRRLHGSCDKLLFPDDKEFYPYFTSTTIHWRRPHDETLNDLSNAIECLTIDKSSR